jgi:hypothetical protein
MADARDTTSRSNQWQDWLNLLLAVWLFVSPWVLGFTTADGGTSVAAWNTCVVAIVSLSCRLQHWRELNLGRSG